MNININDIQSLIDKLKNPEVQGSDGSNHSSQDKSIKIIDGIPYKRVL
jgi:hypothetical protein